MKVELEFPPCPLCGSEEARTLASVADPWELAPAPFGLVRCTQCQLVYTKPRPTADTLGAYYQDVYSGQGGEGMRDAQTNQALWYVNEARWKLMEPWMSLGPTDRVLDVGCGYGAFLAFLHGRSRCQLFGVDADQGSIEGNLCRDHGSFFAGELEDAAYPDDHFSFVSMMHSLEHVRDPVATLGEVARVLRPGGHALVEVPYFGSLLRRVFGRSWFPLLVPQHLLHFETSTLALALRQAGLGNVRVLRPAWCPAELTMSLGPVLGRALGMSSPDQADPASLRARLVSTVLLVVFVSLDLPLSLLLRLSGRSGSLVALVQAESPPD